MTQPYADAPGLARRGQARSSARAQSRITSRPSVVRRRRIVVAVVLVIGAALLGYSLTRPPGDSSFYWLTLALAGVWALGAFASGPLHMGCVRFRGRNQRPVITGTVVGLALGAVFLVGGLVAREIPGVREYITRVLEYANYGPSGAGRVHHRDQRAGRGDVLPRRPLHRLGRCQTDTDLDDLVRHRDGGHHRQSDARLRGDHPGHGVRVRTPSDRRQCSHRC